MAVSRYLRKSDPELQYFMDCVRGVLRVGPLYECSANYTRDTERFGHTYSEKPDNRMRRKFPTGVDGGGSRGR